MPNSTCSKCRGEKPAERVDKYCLTCRRAYNREWEARRRSVDPDMIAARREYRRAYRAANLQPRREQAARYRERHRDIRNEKYRTYYAENAETLRANWRARNAVDPEPAREKRRRRRAREAAADTLPFLASDVVAKLAYWGNKCWMCGAPATALDHVKPLLVGGPHILANFRPACTSCNSSKGGRWFGVHGLERFKAV